MTKYGPVYCSWCFKNVTFDEVEKHFVSRNVYRCQNCRHLGAQCLYGSCAAMARVAPPKIFDKLCAVHNGIVPVGFDDLTKEIIEQATVLQPASGASDAVAASAVSDNDGDDADGGWCSWCFKKAPQKIVNKSILKRNKYCCVNCQRETHACRLCRKNFARAHATWSEELCLKCNKTIDTWLDPEHVRAVTSFANRWCSWCVSQADQTLLEQNILRRSAYTCDACGQRTLPCVRCSDAVACGGAGWDDSMCARCNPLVGVKDWQSKHDEIEAIAQGMLSPDRVQAELERSSVDRSQAAEVGWERPFLFLVAMPPVLRWRVAASLGFSLLTETANVGDPHAEAAQIIMRSGRGMRARTVDSKERVSGGLLGETPTWSVCLRRVAVGAFHTPLSVPSDANGDDDLENEFLNELAELQYAALSPEQRKTQDKLIENGGPALAEASRRIAERIGTSRPKLVSYGVKLISQMPGADKLSKSALALASLNFVATAIGGQSAATALAPVTAAASATLAVVALPLLIISVGSLVKTGGQLLFGSSEGHVFEAVTIILNNKLLLACAEIEIEQTIIDDIENIDEQK